MSNKNLIYGKVKLAKSEPVKPQITQTPVHQPKAYKQLGGLKITNSHVRTFIVDDEKIDVPSPSYIKLLEDQIRDIRREFRVVEANNKKLTNQVNKLISENENIRRELNHKLDGRK